MAEQDIKSSLKATSLFGGVQILTILVSIIRTKIVALLLGPVGIGIVTLYNSTVQLITSFTDFSIYVSAVRDVAIAYKSDDKAHFEHSASVLSGVVWGTGLLGTIVCLLGSPLWSKLTFGNYDYTVGFILLSITLLFNQLKNGKSVLLQATSHFRYIASAGIWGSIAGLLTTIPIYYIWGVDGIVPVIIVGALVPCALYWYYAGKLQLNLPHLLIKEIWNSGKEMLKQGILLSFNFLLSTLIFYILRIFIGRYGGLTEIGLYASSFAIVTTYVGLVFQSMSQEYYPRLSTLSNDNERFYDAINSQIKLCLLLLSPLILFFLTYSEYVLTIFYSEKFLGAGMLLALSLLGVFFQVPGWCMGFAFLAKGDNKAFLIWETVGKIVKIATDIGFYMLWGLTGIGISFIISYLYYTIQCSFVCRRRYGFRLSEFNIKMLVLNVLLGLIVILSRFVNEAYVSIIVGTVATLIGAAISYKMLIDMVDIKDFINNRILKRNR